MDANRRELSRASTGAFDDAASFFGAGGTTSDGGYASSGAGGRDGGGSSVTGGLEGAGGFGGVDGADFDEDDDRDDFDDRSSLYSRSLSASPSRRSDITDPLDDFLKRYTISIMPEETVAKLKKRAGPLVLGINYCPQWDARVTYTAKPSVRGAGPLWWIHKLSYSPGSGAGRRKISGGGAARAASSFSDDDDDDVFVEPLEAAGAGSDASVSGSSVGGAPHRPRRGAAAAAAPSTFSSSLRALGSRVLPGIAPLRHGVATLTSPKLDLLSWLRLQVVADADLATGRFGVRWRVSTKWSTSPGRIGRKERWTVFEGAEIKPRWSVDLYTPEVTGTFGAPQRQLRRGGGGVRRRRRGAAAAAAAAAATGGSANGGSIVDDEAAAAAAAGPGGSAAASATDDEDDLGSASASASSLLSSSAATSFRGRRRGARGRAALDLGHCHLLVPRLDAVVDADAAALSLVRAAKFAAVTPLKVLAGIPLAAARRAAGQVRKRALPPPPPPPSPLPPAPPASSGGFFFGAPFVGPGGPTFPPLPSFLSRSARFRATPAAPPPPPPQFVVRGWPWSLGLADGLESAAGWLRRATEEAEARRRSRARGASA